MIIRKADKTDLEKIMKLYRSCVAGMIKNGIDQWDESYPNPEIIIAERKFPNAYSAFSLLFSPNALEIIEEEPTPIVWDKAIVNIITGIETETPAKAKVPTPRPIKIVSTVL